MFGSGSFYYRFISINIPTQTIPYINKTDKVILFDGDCPLCNAWCRFIISYDKDFLFKLVPMQSKKGQIILTHLGQNTDNFETMLFIEDNNTFKKSTAFIKIVNQLPYPSRLLSFVKFTPKLIRDFIYDRIAQNRFKLFRKYQSCSLPSADHKMRYL